MLKSTKKILITAKLVETEIKKKANAALAVRLSQFFKCKPGEYGYGDLFLGLTVPTTRSFVKKYKDISLQELSKLIISRFHEVRLFSLLTLVEKSKRNPDELKSYVDFYFKFIKHINNWDLVDTSAPHILGTFYLKRNHSKLIQMASSQDLWIKRISILSTFTMIRAEEFKTTLQIAKILLNDEHDLIHKAVGWMLREIGNRNLAVECKFLDQHATTMPRTMLRYAIEKFSPALKRKYMLL